MREAEKREFHDQKLVDDVLRKAKSNFGEKNVKEVVDKVNGTITITISNAQTTVSRKEHRLPEHMRKEGD